MADYKLGIEVDAANALTELKKINSSLEGIDNSIKGLQKVSDNTKKSIQNMSTSMGNSFQKITSGITAVSTGFLAVRQAISDVVNAVNVFIQASVKMKTSLLAVQTVAKNQGENIDKLNQAIKVLSKDGQVAIDSLAYTMKNLLSKGYTVEMAKQMIESEKAIAFYSRQGTYTVSQALERFSEGIKNEMSILTDSAGATKNLVNIWRDYAKQIGVGEKSLTQAQKVQAEFNYFTQEGNKFMAAYQQQVSSSLGVQSRFNVIVNETAAAIGDKLMPAYSAMLDTVGKFLSLIKNLVDVEGRLTRATENLIAARQKYNLLTEQLSDNTKNLTTNERALLESRRELARYEILKGIADVNKEYKASIKNTENLTKKTQDLTKWIDGLKNKQNNLNKSLKVSQITGTDKTFFGQISKFFNEDALKNTSRLYNMYNEDLNTFNADIASASVTLQENIKTYAKYLKDGILKPEDIKLFDKDIQAGIYKEIEELNLQDIIEEWANKLVSGQITLKDLDVEFDDKTIIERIKKRAEELNKNIDKEVKKEIEYKPAEVTKNIDVGLDFKFINLDQAIEVINKEIDKYISSLKEFKGQVPEDILQSLFELKSSGVTLSKEKAKIYDDLNELLTKRNDLIKKKNEEYISDSEKVLSKFDMGVKLNDDDKQILKDRLKLLEEEAKLLEEKDSNLKVDVDRQKEIKEEIDNINEALYDQLSIRDSIIASYNSGAELTENELSFLARSNSVLDKIIKGYQERVAAGQQLTKAESALLASYKQEYDENNKAIDESIRKYNSVYQLGEKIKDGLSDWNDLTRTQRAELDGQLQIYDSLIAALEEKVALNGENVELEKETLELLKEQKSEIEDQRKSISKQKDDSEELTDEQKKQIKQAQKVQKIADATSGAIDGCADAMRTLKDESASAADKMNSMVNAAKGIAEAIASAGGQAAVLGAQLSAALSVIGVAVSAFGFLAEALGMGGEKKTTSGGYDYSGQYAQAQADRREKGAQAYADQIQRVLDTEEEILEIEEEIAEQQKEITDLQKEIAEAETERTGALKEQTAEYEEQTKKITEAIQEEKIRRFESEKTALGIKDITKGTISETLKFYQQLLTEATEKGLDTAKLEDTISNLKGQLRGALTTSRDESDILSGISSTILSAKIETPEIEKLNSEQAELLQKQVNESTKIDNDINDLYNQLTEEYVKLSELKDTQDELSEKYSEEILTSQQMYAQLLTMGLTASELNTIEYGVLNGITDAGQALSGLSEGMYELQQINKETNDILNSLKGGGSFSSTAGGGGGLSTGNLVGGGLGALIGFGLGGFVGAAVGGLIGGLFGGLFHDGGYVGGTGEYSEATRNLLENPLKQNEQIIVAKKGEYVIPTENVEKYKALTLEKEDLEAKIAKTSVKDSKKRAELRKQLAEVQTEIATIERTVSLGIQSKVSQYTTEINKAYNEAISEVSASIPEAPIATFGKLINQNIVDTTGNITKLYEETTIDYLNTLSDEAKSQIEEQLEEEYKAEHGGSLKGYQYFGKETERRRLELYNKATEKSIAQYNEDVTAYNAKIDAITALISKLETDKAQAISDTQNASILLQGDIASLLKLAAEALNNTMSSDTGSGSNTSTISGGGTGDLYTFHDGGIIGSGSINISDKLKKNERIIKALEGEQILSLYDTNTFNSMLESVDNVQSLDTISGGNITNNNQNKTVNIENITQNITTANNASLIANQLNQLVFRTMG